jgi:hypothetical protein
VRDPYDYISPHHLWPTQALTAGAVARMLGVSGLRDLLVVRNSSGRAKTLRVRTVHGWRRFPGKIVREKLHLGSTDFAVRAMTLDEPAARALYGEHVTLRGWVRGLGRARLQEWTGDGWRVVARVRPRADGHFAVTLRAHASTRFRLAYNGLAGSEVPVSVAPRVNVAHDGTELRVRVSPALPLRVERLTHAQWRPVARARGRFARELEPGSYRVTVPGGARYIAAVSPPFGLR